MLFRKLKNTRQLNQKKKLKQSLKINNMVTKTNPHFWGVLVKALHIQICVLMFTTILNSFAQAPATVANLGLPKDNSSAPVTKTVEKFKLVSFNLKFWDDKFFLHFLVIEPSTDCLYLLERSRDNVHFQLMFTKRGAISPSNIPLFYSFVDENPFSGVSYYRLRRFDKNGSSVSEVLTGTNNTTHTAALQQTGSN